MVALLSHVLASPRVKHVDYLYERATNRKIGYVVTKVHAIEPKEQRRSGQDNGNESANGTSAAGAKTADRSAFIDDGHGT